MRRGGEVDREKKERTGPAAGCLAGIIFHQSLILSIKAVGLLFFLSSCNLPPPLPFRVIVALATVANLPFLKQMSHLVGN